MKKLCYLMLILLPCVANAQWILKNTTSPKKWVSNPGVYNNSAWLLNRGDSVKAYQYDPAANVYTAKAFSGLMAGWQDLSFTINNQVYLVQFADQITKMYDANTNTWVAKDQTANDLQSILLALFPPSAYGFEFNGSLFAFSINNKGYIGGLTLMQLPGNTEMIAPFLFEYNPVSDTYNPINIANLGGLMSVYNMLYPTTFELNGKIYIVGNERNPTLFNPGNGVEIIEFDPLMNTMTVKTGCNCGQLNGSASFALNGLGFVNVNNNCPGITAVEPVYTYNPNTDTWAYHSSLPAQDTAYLTTGFCINGKGYIGVGTNLVSGCTATAFNPNLFEFTPDGVSVDDKAVRKILLYPNPATKSVSIPTGDTDETNVTIVIYSATGSIVPSSCITNTGHDIVVNVEDIPSGVYFIRYTSATASRVFQFLK